LPTIRWEILAEQVDTGTPMGKMIFTVLGAVSELERDLIVERVHVGLRHARSKGKRLERPEKMVDATRIASLRASGCSWRNIVCEMKLSVGTVFGAMDGIERDSARPQTERYESYTK
jgi:DNA invertase Pin-like site-specific DNA recombinase